MRAHDIKFVMNSGEHQGDEYGFTLATVDGRKAWDAVRIFPLPPSLIKERIDLILTAREGNIPLSGAMELKVVDRILDQLETISWETDPVKLHGIDGQERSVRVGREGRAVIPVVHESGKEPEYRISVTCWSLYE